MRLSDGFGTYFKASDFADGARTFTIDHIANEEVGEDKELKQVVHFKEDGAKRLVLNKTNAERIDDIHKCDMEDLGGKQIELYKTQTDMGGRQVDCTRVREAPAPF